MTTTTQLRGWVQYDIAGNAMPDYPRRGNWMNAARASAAKWLKPASLASEVKVALRRHKLTPAVSAKQYAEWAKGETRPIPTTFYDGRIDTARAAIAARRITASLDQSTTRAAVTAILALSKTPKVKLPSERAKLGRKIAAAEHMNRVKAMNKARKARKAGK